MITQERRAGAAGRGFAPIRLLAMVLFFLQALNGHAGLTEYFRNGLQVGPNYREPQVWVSEGWIDERDPRVSRKPPLTLEWWRVFDDPVLCRLINQALAQNLSIREACVRIDEANARRRLAEGTLFPQIQRLSGADLKVNILESERKLLTEGGAASPEANIPTVVQIPGASAVAVGTPGGMDVDWIRARNLGLTAVWELDFWGKYRRSVEAANAVLESSWSASDAVVVLVTSQVAENYIDLRTFEELLRQSREDRKQLVSVKKRLEKEGATTLSLTLSTLQLLIAGLDAEMSVYESGRRAANNSLCLVLGMPPTDLELGHGSIPAPPENVAVGIPCDLVRRRPDVVRLERLAAAESARIGVAEADFYPAIGIAGKLVGNTRRTGDLVESKNLLGATGPIFNWNILDYGRTAARVREQRAGFEQAVLRYQEAVLRANQEADTALSAYLNSRNRSRALADAKAEAGRVVAELLPRATSESELSLLFSVASFSFSARWIQSRGAVARNLITLYKALGGGWETRLPPR